MDLNDPRRRLQVMQANNPSLRVAAAPDQPLKVGTFNPNSVKLYVGDKEIKSSPNDRIQSGAVPRGQSFVDKAREVITSPFRPFAEGLTYKFSSADDTLQKRIAESSAQDDANAALFTKLYKEGKMSPEAYARGLQGVSRDSQALSNMERGVQTQVDKSRFLGSAAQVASAPFALSGFGAKTLAGKVASEAGIGAGQGILNEFSGNTDPTAKGAVVQGTVGGVSGGATVAAGSLLGKAWKFFKGRGSNKVLNSLVDDVVKETDPAALSQTLGVDQDVATYLAQETDKTAIKNVLKELEIDSTKPKPVEKSFAPITEDTKALVDDLADRASKTPKSPGTTRVFQVSEGNGPNEWVFDDENTLANFINGRTSPDMKVEFYDVPTERLRPTANGEHVFKVDGDLTKPATELPATTKSFQDLPKNVGDGFVMADKGTRGLSGLVDELNKIDQKLHDIQIGKVPSSRIEINAIKARRDELIKKAQEPFDYKAVDKANGVEPTPDLSPEDAKIQKELVDAPSQSGTDTSITAEAAPTPTNIGDEVSTNADAAVAKNTEAAQAAPSSAVDDVLSKLDEASKLYNPEAKAFSKKRGAALYRGADAAQAEGGLAGHYEQLKALKGVKKQTGFQPIQVTPEVRDEVLTKVHSSALLPGEKLSANTGMLKVFGIIDGAPTPSERALIRKALGDDIADALEQNVELAGKSLSEKAAMIASTPKAAMATLDLSAPLRQGGVLGTRFPKQFGQNAAEMIKYFGSPKHFDEAMAAVKARPNYETYSKMGLSVEAAEGVKGTEEAFMTSLLQTEGAKKILGYGYAVQASDRAYSGFLTKFRADVADKILADVAKSGVELDEKALKSLGEFINSASGRGNLGSLERHSGLLSKALFSPRLWKSRLDLLNPVYYARLTGPARKYALQSSAAFASVAGTVLGLASLAGAEVLWDPRSADFAKIKVGNTRYDILGGLQQNIRLGAQLITGEKINSSTGELQTLGDGFTSPSRKDLLYQFFENKENPLIGYATKVLEGKDAGGNPINPLTEAGKLFVPLTVQGAVETAKDTGNIPKALAMNTPGIFGVGVQTYGNTKTKDQGPEVNGMPSFKGKITPEMVTDKAGKAILDDKGRPIKIKIPKDATDLERQALIDDKRKSALSDQYKKTLSKEDQALFKLDDEKLQDYVDSDKITQDRYDQIKQYQKNASNIDNIKIPDGVTSKLAKSFYTSYNSLSKNGQEKYLKDAPDETAKTITSLLNKERSAGLSEFKPSNALSKAYSEYEADLNSHPEYTTIDKRNKAQSFQKEAYKLNYSTDQNDIYTEGPSADLRYLIDQKQVSKADLDAAINMDNELYNSGLTGTLKFSKKFRNEYGYSVPSGGSGASGGGGGDSTPRTGITSLLPSFKTASQGGKRPDFGGKPKGISFKSPVKLPSKSSKKISIKL